MKKGLVGVGLLVLLVAAAGVFIVRDVQASEARVRARRPGMEGNDGAAPCAHGGERVFVDGKFDTERCRGDRD